MFDVFYKGSKPNLFSHEEPANDIIEASTKSRTKFFWFINSKNDYSDFDFTWQSDLWEAEYTHVFPDQWNRNSETYFSSAHSNDIKYRNDQYVSRYPEKNIAVINSNKTVKIGEAANSLMEVLGFASDTNLTISIDIVKNKLDGWLIPDDVDINSIDFSWHPDPTAEPYIYQFPTADQKASGVEFHVQSATRRKFTSAFIVKFHNNKTNWVYPDDVDINSIDFSWHPDPTAEPYIYQFPTKYQRTSGVEYHVNGAIKRKYIDPFIVQHRAVVDSRWIIPITIDRDSIDFTWRPDSFAEPFNYQFPSDHQRASGVIYKVKGALQDKFVTSHTCRNKSNTEHWVIPADVDKSSIDFTWHPDTRTEPLVYIFPTKFQRASGVEYRPPGSERIMFVKPFNVKHNPSKDNWIIPDDINQDTIDFAWRPDQLDPSFIYVFPTKYQRDSGVRYNGPGALKEKFIGVFQVQHTTEQRNWIIPDDVDKSSIDFTWRPDRSDNVEYCYQFPTKFQRSSGVEYKVSKKAIKNNYVNSFNVKHNPSKDNWIIPDDILNPNLTWRPNPLDPPFIYKFPSEYVRESGLEYHVPEATETKFVDDISVSFDAEALPRYYISTTIEDLILEHKDELFWALNKEMDYDEFDFAWHPDASQRGFLHVFGSQWQNHSQTFYVDEHALSATDRHYNFVSQQQVKANSTSDIFFIDKHNDGSKEQFANLSKIFPNISRIRFVGDILRTMERCSSKAKTSKFWVISSENDYSDFNFGWHAGPWQSYMFHVFGSEQQKWSDTYLVNKNTFDNHMDWCKDIKDMPDLHFVEDQKTKAINVNDIYQVDFGQYDLVKQVIGKTTRFNDSYLAVIKRIVVQSTSEYIWLTSNICDYINFDFDWRPEPYQADMLHVFRSGNQKFGDTFLIHIPTFKDQMNELELLDWFETVNYCTEQIVPRLPYDMVPYYGDNLTAIIKEHRFNSPYGLFYKEEMDISKIDYDPSVWRLKDRAIHTFTESGSVVLAPKDSVQFLGTQCYDYPQIMPHKDHFLPEKPMDIVFVSNGESTADAMYAHLINITKQDKNLVVKRISGVNGRAAAYQACANASDTDWFFNVFAKLEMDADFDFYWQPDRLQEPKHYIFNAKNPINGLEYGHQGCIAYNKKLVLETNEWGLDFTLSKAHEVIPVLSGIARYDTDPWIVWRTAFREVIKLLSDNSDESKYRLSQWLIGTNGEHGQMSLHGANDSVDYYNSVDGDMDKLLLTFEWEWLDAHYTELGYKD